MKISINPTGKFSALAQDAVNTFFNRQANVMIQRDQEHSAKRVIAKIVLAGGDATAEFTSEATLTGVTIQELATTVLAKPDEVMARALLRRTAIIGIRNASSVDQIKTVLTTAGISELQKDLLARQL